MKVSRQFELAILLLLLLAVPAFGTGPTASHASAIGPLFTAVSPQSKNPTIDGVGYDFAAPIGVYFGPVLAPTLALLPKKSAFSYESPLLGFPLHNRPPPSIDNCPLA